MKISFLFLCFRCSKDGVWGGCSFILYYHYVGILQNFHCTWRNKIGCKINEVTWMHCNKIHMEMMVIIKRFEGVSLEFFTPQQFEIFKLGLTLIFLWQILAILWKIVFFKNIFSQIHEYYFIFEKRLQKIQKMQQKSIIYNLKMCLKCFIFIFWILPNLAKHNYGLWPFEHHHKIGKKKNNGCHTTFPSIL